MDELVANRSPIDSQVWKWAWLGNMGCSAWFFRLRFRWQIRIAVKKAMDKMPMPKPIIMNSFTCKRHFTSNIDTSLERALLKVLTSLSVTQFISSEVSMCPQLLIPLHRSVLGMQIWFFAQRNSWQLEVSLNSVQMALKPLAPTALSAKKNLERRRQSLQ